MRRQALVALFGVLALAACSVPQGAPGTPPIPATPSPKAQAANIEPCGGTAAKIRHVVWIWMENHSYSQVIGNPAAPYENSLAADCGLATNYYGVTHPSLPNYLAATGGSTFGVSDDAGPDAHPINAPSIFQQVTNAGMTWRAYEESMPGTCAQQSSGEYAVKHNPAAYFTPIRGDCAKWDVPLTELQTDVAAGVLPNFAFVTPNLCDDTHDCGVATGDAWLAQWIPRILAGPDYRRADTVIVITWDEGTVDQRIPTIIVAPSVAKGLRAGERFDHYALLRTTEDLLGLPPLGDATKAPSMALTFGL